MPSLGRMRMTSPIFKDEVFMVIGKPPESCAVSKKMGAMISPMNGAPLFLLGTSEMSVPVKYASEFQADLRDDSVPVGPAFTSTGRCPDRSCNSFSKSV